MSRLWFCSDLNECDTNHGGCSTYADCINTPGSFSCLCREGFHGNGFNCTRKLVSLHYDIIQTTYSSCRSFLCLRIYNRACK